MVLCALHYLNYLSKMVIVTNIICKYFLCPSSFAPKGLN